MNLLRHELRAGWKPFLFWNLGIAVLMLAGTVKYTGIEGSGGAATQLLEQFPKVVLAMLGIVGVDVNTLGGYYAVLSYFALLCTALYAIHLGGGAVSRESVDKTYEFLFTKPRSRARVLGIKLGAGLLFLLGFSLMSYLFSLAGVASLSLTEDITKPMLLFCLGNLLLGLLFFSLAAVLAAGARRAERGALVANLCFLAAFVMGIVYDTLENGSWLRPFSPLKYFLPNELLAGRLPLGYAAGVLGLSALCLGGAFYLFEKRDLQAA